jgi:hypothetical protein
MTVHVGAWEELQPFMRELQSDDALLMYTAGGPGHEPPFTLLLEPWALDVATELHRRFGDAVELHVGAMTFPGRRIVPSSVEPRPSILIEPDDITVNLEGPNEVRSGMTLNTDMRLHNHTDAGVDIHSQGEWTDTRLVDLDTGDIVGGYKGYIPRQADIKPRTVFQLHPHGSVLIPLTVGTASTVPELGYAVPAGKWGLVAYLWFAGHEYVRTPPMPFTVT